MTGQFVLANNILCVATAEPGLLLSRTSETGTVYRNLECFIHVKMCSNFVAGVM